MDDVFGDLFATAVSIHAHDSANNRESVGGMVKEQEPPRVRPLTRNLVVFDCETGPEDSETLSKLFTFDVTKVKGHELVDAVFDPATVKYGNTKAPDKRAEKLAAEREKFDEAVKAAKAAVAKAAEDQWMEFVQSAALSAITGRVLAIGYADEGDCQGIAWDIDTDANGEEMLLAGFWERFEELKAEGKLIGFNSHGFDLPFLVRRSWLLGVDVPGDVMQPGGRYWHRCFIDLMQVWQCGCYRDYIGLDRVAQFFGGPRKMQGVGGADFARLYHGTDEERQQALDYLKADLAATVGIAIRMGVL